MYDWANSAYNLVITSTIFPAYYTAITTTRDQGKIINDTVDFFGWRVNNTALFDYAVAFAYLLIAILSPILSSIADSRGNKKVFMRFFAYLGSISCVLLYFFKLNTFELGLIAFILAAVGYCGSLVFYNAFLPEIAHKNEQDKVSAMGFAYGYIGSVILQLICFLFVFKYDWFGQSEDWGPRFSFLLVGIWWFLFAQIPLRNLPENVSLYPEKNKNIFTKGFIELKKVYLELKHLPSLKLFIAAFFLYSMGVQTVMLAATIFGSKELNLETSQLVITILIIQLVAIAGAYLIARLSKMWGNIRVLQLVVFIWIIVCILAYFTHTLYQFFGLAVLVGLVMGGIQSLSRSTYSKLMPQTNDTTSYFSFYDVAEKLAIVLGMFSFGIIDHITGSMRNSIAVLIVFFVLGLILLLLNNRANKQIASQLT